MKGKRVPIGIWMQRLVLPLLDMCVVWFGYYCAEKLLYNFQPLPLSHMAYLGWTSLYVIPVYLLLFFVSRLYATLWKYAGSDELVRCAGVSAFAGATLYAVERMLDHLGLFGVSPRPNAAYFIAGMVIITLTFGMRVFYRAVRRFRHKISTVFSFVSPQPVKRLLIIGAGDMGNIVISELRANDNRLGVPVAIADDNPAKRGMHIGGVRVCGDCNQLPQLVEKYRIDEIFFCIPSAEEERRSEILKAAIATGVDVKVSPTLLEMRSLDGSGTIGRMHRVGLEDLLMRPRVQLDEAVCSYLKGHTVLVTGGGGSIGSEICRQAAKYRPRRIVIFDIYENNAFTLKNELDRLYGGKPEVFIRIGSVRDPEALERVFTEFLPSCVFHAAAHKHVPLMEDSPLESVKNNVFGTRNVCEAAVRFGSAHFVMLSTDKAVNPANVMGATKRAAECILFDYARCGSKTKFAAVRFGNVLGSNGSVVPLFEKQIDGGGPVTVTHPEMTRFFMLIPEAAELVLQAGGLSKGGDLFILDMGKPVRILDLAEQLISLRGLRPYVDIPIEITGLRPGEKLHEELFVDDEQREAVMTQNEKIYVTYPVPMKADRLKECLRILEAATERSVRADLQALVPNYTYTQPETEEVHWFKTA
ncbi:MAG: polysaccharide biosynthesis protein [Oscillospiraceae bacterium]|nr:polysaccharide biosynthesis protein [Oscillospiraceae bacterium]